ncbi:MAG: response regulator receiver modulated metal dependent phosphohydrolase [Gemmatimonadetes bacterium]|nr:response regulator receiver modulated metal dependent phosphohydrolase [Gemmatimonadota bacterium]
MNIIVADDDKVLSAMICGVLNDHGHITLPAYDSIQTMMFVMKQPPDLLILDIKMPGGTGLNVLRKLKSSSKTSYVPVIVISGMPDENIPAEVLELGARRFLAKPIDPDVLLETVRDVFR